MAKNLDYQIRWLTDTASLNKTIQDTKRLETVVDTGFDQLVNSARRGELSIDELRLALRQVGSEEDEIDKVTRALKEADAAAKQLASDTEGGLITASGRSLLRGEREETRFQSFALGTFGDIPGIGGTEAFGVASGVFQLVDALPNLDFAAKSVVASIKENVAQIGTTGVGLVGGLALAALGFKLLTDEATKNYDATRTLLGAQRNYFEIIQTGTTKSIALEQERVQQQLNAAQGNRNLLQAQSDALNADLKARFGDSQILNDVAIGLGLVGGEAQGLRDELDAANAEVAALEKQITDLGVAAGSAEVAINTAAEDMRQLADDQLEGARRSFELESLTKEQRDERIAQMGREVEFYYDLIQSGVLVGDAVLQAQTHIEGLVGDMTELSDISQTYADVLAEEEARKKALSDQTDAYFDALKEEGEIRDEIAKINQKISDIQLETAEKVLAIETERDERIAQITAEHTDKLGDITAEGEQKRIDIIADSSAKIEKIQRDSGRKLFNLVAQRDALAHYLESIQAAQQVQDEKDAAGKALTEQKKAEDKSLAQAVKAYDKALQTQNAAADKQIRNLYDATNRQLQIQYNGLQAEQVALQNQQVALQNIALYGSSGRRIIETQLWQDVNAIAVSWAANTVNSINNIFGAVFGGGGSTGGGGGGGGFGPSQQAVFNRNFDRRLSETRAAGRELIA